MTSVSVQCKSLIVLSLAHGIWGVLAIGSGCLGVFVRGNVKKLHEFAKMFGGERRRPRAQYSIGNRQVRQDVAAGTMRNRERVGVEQSANGRNVGGRSRNLEGTEKVQPVLPVFTTQGILHRPCTNDCKVQDTRPAVMRR